MTSPKFSMQESGQVHLQELKGTVLLERVVIEAQGRVGYVLIEHAMYKSGTVHWHGRFLHLLRGTNILAHH